MTRVQGPDGVVYEAHQLTKDNAVELSGRSIAVIVHEIDPIDSTQVYVGLNVMGSGDAFRVSEGDYLLQNLETGRWVGVLAGFFERDYTEVAGE